MRQNRIVQALIVAITSVMVPSCLFSSTSDTIVHPDAERRTTRFENDEALIAFQATVHRRYERGKGVKSSSSFAIPFVVHSESRQVLSENAFYNEQVTKADVDGDGAITLIEARAYDEGTK